MKRLIFSIFLVLVLAIPALAVTNTATKAGNWSDTTVWDQGHVPTAGEDVALAGYVIVWDIGTVPVIPATGSLGTVTSTGTAGQISIALDDAACHGNETCKITATTITAGTKPTTAGIVLIAGTGAISDHVLGIHANVVGGSNSTAYGVNNSSTGTVTITGNSTAGTSTSCHGVANTSTGVLNVVGNVTGGGVNSSGYYNGSTGTGTITGNVTASGTYDNAGVYASGAGVITLVGSIIDGSIAVGWKGRTPSWSPGNTYYHQLADGTKLYVSTDPGVANVKTGTGYYIQGSSLTGTMASGGGAWGF